MDILIFHIEIDYSFVFVVIGIPTVLIVVLQDYSLSWSKATQKTFLLKSMVYVAACVYAPLYYGHFYLYFMLSELFVYLFAINAAMYGYHYMIHRRKTAKDKTLVICGAGKAGLVTC